MTATQPATPACPECGGQNTMVLSDGMARCFDDQHEWDPKSVAALPRPPAAVPSPEPTAQPATDADSAADSAGGVPADESSPITATSLPEPPALEPFGMASTEEVFGPDLAGRADGATVDTDDLIGGTARLEGGQVALVLSFPDADHVVVRLNDGRDETVPLSDVERITRRAPEPEPTEDGTDAGDVAEWITDVRMLSDLILAAGVATVYDQAGENVVGQPPAGWLPRDATTNALVEAAVAVTVARLIVAYSIDTDDILEGVSQTIPVIQTDDPTEVPDHDPTATDTAHSLEPGTDQD